MTARAARAEPGRTTRSRRVRAARGRFTVAVIGAGGNIGSHLVTHLARCGRIGRITLVDPDRYNRANVVGQDIARDAIGRPKVDVLAQRLRGIDPAIDVVPIAAAVEDVPLGALHADVVLSCPDSRRARLAVNRAVWRLGIPWIDAGVDAGGMLARVTTRRPDPHAACLACTMGPADYALVELEYPCGAGAPPAATPTGAPSYLGALAAALQAAECVRLLDGAPDRAEAGHERIVSVDASVAVATSLRRNPACAFDHDIWRIERLSASPAQLTLGEALDHGDGGDAPLHVEGQSFVRRLECTGCGHARLTLRLSRRIDDAACPGCGGLMQPTGFHTHDVLDRKRISTQGLAGLTLAAAGFLPGDVFTVGGRHLELGVTS